MKSRTLTRRYIICLIIIINSTPFLISFDYLVLQWTDKIYETASAYKTDT